MARLAHNMILGGLWGAVIGGVLDFGLVDPEYWILLALGVGVILTLTDISYNKKESK